MEHVCKACGAKPAKLEDLDGWIVVQMQVFDLIPWRGIVSMADEYCPGCGREVLDEINKAKQGGGDHGA